MRRAGTTLHRGARASHYRGLSLRSTGSRRAGSVVVAHGLSCSTACGIFPDQGLNRCPLHWQADSQPLRHQGSPKIPFLKGSITSTRMFKTRISSSLKRGGFRIKIPMSLHEILKKCIFLSSPALLHTKPNEGK